MFRIVTAVNPLYEVARGDDVVTMMNTAWKFINVLQERLDPSLSTKERIAEVIRQLKVIGDYNMRKNRGDIQSPSVMSGLNAGARASGLQTAVVPTPVSLADRQGGGKRNGDKRGSISGVYTSIAQSPFVAEAMIPFEGIIAYVVFFCVTFIPILLLRDASPENFRLALVIFYALAAPIITFGYPKAIGITILAPRADFKHVGDYYQALAVAARKGEQRGGEDENTSDDECSSDDEEEDIKSQHGTPTTPSANPTIVAPFSPRGMIPLLTVKPARTSADANAYADLHGQSFQVRCGPNYKKNKLKAPSDESLFYLIGVDIYNCKQRVSHLMQYMDLEPLYSRLPAPVVAYEKSAIDKTFHDVRRQVDEAFTTPGGRALNLAPGEITTIQPGPDGFTLGTMEKPLIFVAVFQIPTYSPGKFTSITDGPGLCVIQYFAATPETQRDLLRQNPRSNAVRILRDLLLAVPGTEESKRHLERMKCIPRLVNDDELSMNWIVSKMVKGYNAKPFLSRPQHAVFRGPGYYEFDLDVHAFCTAARTVLDSFLTKMSDVVLDWAYTVEAYDDNEMPECVLGAFRLYRCEMYNRPSWEASLEAYLSAKAKGAIPESDPLALGYPADLMVKSGNGDHKGDSDNHGSIERKENGVSILTVSTPSESALQTTRSTYLTPLPTTATTRSAVTSSGVTNSPRGGPMHPASQASYHTASVR